MFNGTAPPEFHNSILMDENALPSFMLVENVNNGWTGVKLNSFNRLHPWMEQISRELDTTAIHIIGQTVSDVYYFQVYEKGVLRRNIEIYHGDYDQSIDEGNKFPFEKASLIPQDDDWENFDAFDIDTIQAYCKQFGFDIFNESEPGHYIILKKKDIGDTIQKYMRRGARSKPWWKFW